MARAASVDIVRAGGAGRDGALSGDDVVVIDGVGVAHDIVMAVDSTTTPKPARMQEAWWFISLR